MIIVIPTFMREERQVCFNNLPASIKECVHLVTHSGRADELKAKNPGANVLDLGVTDGIADVRQKVLELAEAEGFEKVFIIDDGCKFKKRVDMKLVDMAEEDYVAMFSKVEGLLDKYIMVGISDQAGNNRVEEDVKEIQRSYSCYGINVKLAKENGIRFDAMYQKNSEIKLYEDFYFILKLLTTGHKNAVVFDYAFSHAHGKAGGNSTIRTNELQKKCILALRDEFPGFVEPVKKENPSWKAGLDDQDSFRWELRISWLAAYNSSKEQITTLEDFF